MTLQPYKVGLVVDRSFGSRIAHVARSFHTWVVESPGNTPIIQQFWKEEQPDLQGDPLGPGVTSFVAGESESLEAVCVRLVGDMDEHHGELAHDPPWSEIEVFGVKLSPALQTAFEEIGATDFEPTQEGVISRRRP